MPPRGDDDGYWKRDRPTRPVGLRPRSDYRRSSNPVLFVWNSYRHTVGELRRRRRPTLRKTEENPRDRSTVRRYEFGRHEYAKYLFVVNPLRFLVVRPIDWSLLRKYYRIKRGEKKYEYKMSLYLGIVILFALNYQHEITDLKYQRRVSLLIINFLRIDKFQFGETYAYVYCS